MRRVVRLTRYWGVEVAWGFSLPANHCEKNIFVKA